MSLIHASRVTERKENSEARPTQNPNFSTAFFINNLGFSRIAGAESYQTCSCGLCTHLPSSYSQIDAAKVSMSGVKRVKSGVDRSVPGECHALCCFFSQCFSLLCFTHGKKLLWAESAMYMCSREGGAPVL